MKECNQCKEYKIFAEFARDNRAKDSYKQICRVCDNARGKKYYCNNRELVLKKKKARLDAQDPKIKRQKWQEAYLRYKAKGKVKKPKDKKRTKRGRMADKLGGKLRKFLKSPNPNHYRILFGCTVGEFRKHIESQFTQEMTWENWGPIWELDHIKPYSLFDLFDESQVLEVCHYTNVRPLLKELNISRQHPKPDWSQERIDFAINEI